MPVALVYGTDGVGKSTFCSHAPNPIFVGAEKGTEQLDVARFPQTETIQDLLDQLRALQTRETRIRYGRARLASDWIEPLIWKSVCDEAKVESIEQAFGGYGKGYVRALDLWRTLLKELAILNRTMHVLMIGHAQIKSFQDPDLASAYDRYQLKINDKAAALVREAADAVLFARFETELFAMAATDDQKPRFVVKASGSCTPRAGPDSTPRTGLTCPSRCRWTGKRSVTLSVRFTGSRIAMATASAKPENAEPLSAVTASRV